MDEYDDDQDDGDEMMHQDLGLTGLDISKIKIGRIENDVDTSTVGRAHQRQVFQVELIQNCWILSYHLIH